MKIGTAVLLLMFLGYSLATASGRSRSIPCKTPENASACYWTHGRLVYANGMPAFRLWKIGTKRLLGIYSGPAADRLSLDNEDPQMPANLERIFNPPETQVFGDFEVCPLEPVRDGAMQAACIESAKNLVVK